MSGPSERDEIAAVREALIDALYADKDLGPGYMLRDDCEHLADRFLASDWLAERDRRTAAKALREAAEGRDLRLSGHSGISIRRLRDRADRIERGEYWLDGAIGGSRCIKP